MSKGSSCIPGILALGFGMLVLAVVSFMAFVFPKTIAQWEVMSRPLSLPERLACALSRICTNYGFILIPALVLLIAASIVWLVTSLSRKVAKLPTRQSS